MGYFGYGNSGDEAILACLVDRLRALGVADRLIIFTAEPEATAALHGVRAVHGIHAPSPSAYLRGFLGRNRQRFVSTLKAFRSCDTIIIGGGGLLLDRPTTARYLLELLAKVEWAIRLGKRVIVLGVGIGPLYLAPSRIRLRDVLNKVEIISVRDADSRALLEEIGVTRPELHTTADFAFLLEPASTTRTDEL